MEYGRDELAEQRRKKQLTPAGRDLLEKIERAADLCGQSSEEILERMNTLSPSDLAELISILGARVDEEEARTEKHERNADLLRSAAEAIHEAQERELAAGRQASSHLTLREALEILGR